MNDNDNGTGGVIDLSTLDDDVTEFRAWINMPISAKPSVSYGPGRGKGRGPGWFRAYLDTGVKKQMKAFGSLVHHEANSQGFVKLNRNIPVQVKAWCYIRRPDTDFISRRRAANNLRSDAQLAQNTFVTVKPDVDNLAKFVLDSLTGVLFADDAQVVDFHCVKLRDDIGLCEGRVALEVSVLDMTTANLIKPNF